MTPYLLISGGLNYWGQPMRFGEIDNPTTRKVVNRGFEPICYHMETGQHTGWIYKEGRTLLHIYLIGIGHRKVAQSERRSMINPVEALDAGRTALKERQRVADERGIPA